MTQDLRPYPAYEDSGLPFYFFGGIVAVCQGAWETSKGWRIPTLD